MSDGLPEMHMSDDEETGPAGPYEPESESEDEDGHPPPPPPPPPAKRARELHACGVPGGMGALADEPRPGETPGQQSRRELQALMATAEVKRILSELDDHPELQLLRRQGKQPRATEVQRNTD